MTFRSRLLLALAPLGLSLLAVAWLSSSVVVRLGENSSHILADNYRSVLAAQRMKEALERIDSGALFTALGQAGRGEALIAEQRGAFEEALRAEEGNITEAGEAEVVRDLRTRWTDYRGALDAFLALPVEKRGPVYFDLLEARFSAVRRGADQILALNQDAMSRKSDRARKGAESFVRAIVLAAIALCAFGLWASTALTRRFLRPLSVVSQAVRRFGEGDVQARARLPGKDELAKLASDFNDMADHLERYRRSSLGELLLAQQASQAAIDALPDPVLLLGVHGELLNANLAATSLLRIAPEAAEPLAAIDPALQAVFGRLRSHVFSGQGAYLPKGFDEALRLPTPEGERYLLPRAAPVYGEERQVSGAAVVLSDVTRLLRADELKNDLVAFVAHEFRTPLTSLQMAVHLCAEEMAGPVTEKQADLLFAAREDCERLQAIVNDLLDVSRIHEGKISLALSELDGEELARQAVAEHAAAASERGIRLGCEVLPGLAPVLADAARVRLVLDNLLGNALRYTPAGGKVTVRARAEASDRMRFEVVDTGPGIPREQQALVFEKFYRLPGTQPQGAGLGLFIAREIVRAHHGTVGIDSEPGKGSTFWFTLPLAGKTAT
ncbi:MAG TPA: ATP-binding protein [Myxococcales bacterium]|jgi:signal transduction histidine kinase/HAMP domain-containing protein